VAVKDPAAESLARLWRDVGSDGIVAALFGPGGRFAADWSADHSDARVLAAAVARRLA
jgi:fructuronate reductase